MSPITLAVLTVEVTQGREAATELLVELIDELTESLTDQLRAVNCPT